MSGNVDEWVNSCDPIQDGVPPYNDNCQTRGGGVFFGASQCSSSDATQSRSTGSSSIGFRCCR